VAPFGDLLCLTPDCFLPQRLIGYHLSNQTDNVNVQLSYEVGAEPCAAQACAAVTTLTISALKPIGGAQRRGLRTTALPLNTALFFLAVD